MHSRLDGVLPNASEDLARVALIVFVVEELGVASIDLERCSIPVMMSVRWHSYLLEGWEHGHFRIVPGVKTELGFRSGVVISTHPTASHGRRQTTSLRPLLRCIVMYRE